MWNWDTVKVVHSDRWFKQYLYKWRSSTRFHASFMYSIVSEWVLFIYSVKTKYWETNMHTMFTIFCHYCIRKTMFFICHALNFLYLAVIKIFWIKINVDYKVNKKILHSELYFWENFTTHLYVIISLCNFWADKP